jgi:hypothetical protein
MRDNFRKLAQYSRLCPAIFNSIVMQTVTVQLTDRSARKALQDLEQKHVIRIVKSPQFESPALPGKPMDLADFQAWIASSQETPSVSLKAAKSTWAAKRKQLQQLTK